MVSLNIQEKREHCSLPGYLICDTLASCYCTPMSNKIQLMERSSITALSHQTLTEPKLIFTDT